MAITLDGTTGITVSGNITGNNISASGTLSVGSFAPSSLTVSGNVAGGNVTTSGVFAGSGAQLTNIPAANVSGTVATATTAGTVTTAAQPNITSVGTLSSLAVTGNITGGNVIATHYGSGAGLSSLTGANVTGTVATATTAGTVTTAAQPNITSVGTLSSLAVTGNITGGNVIATHYGSGAGLSSLTGANVSGAVATATTAGTVTTAAQPNITSVGTLSSLTVTANVAGGNITTAGQLVSSVITGTAPLVITSTTKVTNLNVEQVDGFHAEQAGTVNTIVVRDASGYANVAGLINSGANGVGNIGTSLLYFNTAFVKATSAQYADLAEMYVADANYQPGTVLEFGGNHEVTMTTESHSTRVAGIVSTNPSYLMNATQEGEYVVAVALTGRVPCRVQGPVRKGDVLVSSDTPGVAQRIGVNYQPGCTVGKSMEIIESNEIRVIEVAVGRL